MVSNKEYLKKYRKTAKWKSYYSEWLKKHPDYHSSRYQELKNKAKMYENQQRSSESSSPANNKE